MINVLNLIKLHPYQNIYFNFLVEKKANSLFEIDYWGVSNKDALEKITKNNLDRDEIVVGVASFTNLYLSKKITILVAAYSDDLFLAARNIPNIYLVEATSASTYDLLDCESLLFDKAGLSLINKQLKLN